MNISVTVSLSHATIGHVAVYHLKCLNEKTGERWTLGKRYTDWANLARALHDKSPESSAHSTFPPYQLFNPLSPASVQFRLEQLRVFLGELQADESLSQSPAWATFLEAGHVDAARRAMRSQATLQDSVLESLARECRAVREAHGPQDPRLCGPLVAMAQRLVQLESPSEADVLLRRALTLRQTPALIASFDTVDLLDTLADVNDSLGATLPAAAFRDQSAALLSSLREKHAESSTCGCSRLDVSLEALVRLALLVSTLTRYSLISTVYLALFCVVSYLSPLLAFPLGHIQSSTLRWKLSASVAVVAVLACILRALYAILAKRGDAGHVAIWVDFDLVDHLSPSLTFANTIQDVIVAVLAAVHTAVSKGGSYVCSPTPWQPGQTRKAALRTRSFDGNYRLSIVISTVALLLASTLVPSYVGSLFLLVLLTLLVCTVKSLRITRVVLHVALLAAASYAFVWHAFQVSPPSWQYWGIWIGIVKFSTAVPFSWAYSAQAACILVFYITLCTVMRFPATKLIASGKASAVPIVKHALRAASGRVGTLFVLACCILWAALFPTVLALPPLLFAVAMVVSSAWTRRMPFPPASLLLLLAVYTSAVLLAEYGLALWAMMFHPDDFKMRVFRVPTSVPESVWRIGVDLVNPPFARNVVQLLCLVSSSCVYSTRGSSVVAEQNVIPVFIYPDAKLGGKWFLTRLVAFVLDSVMVTSQPTLLVSLFLLAFQEATIFNGGYLLLLMSLLICSHIPRWMWLLTVSYCATALVFLFVWKSIVLRWVRSLPSYVIVLDDTLSTWTRLVIPASVALVFASLSSARQGVPTMTPLRAFLATYPSPLRTVYSVCLSVHRTVGPLVTYLVTLLVCINPPLLALKLVIIIVCMLTLILHLVAGVSAPAHSKPIQSALAKLYRITAVLQTVFVLAMYIFEFEGVISPVLQRWKTDVIALKQLGLYLSTSANSRLAKFVGPMVIIFLFTAQRQVLLEPNPDGFVPRIPGRNRSESHVVSITSEEPNEPSTWRRFVSVLVSVLSLIAHLFSSFARFVFDVLVAGLFYHSGKAALIAIVAVSCFPASVMGAVYVTLAVLVALSSALSGGHPVDTDKPLFVRVWLPWLLLAACFLVAKYVYQAALFAPANGNHWFTAGNSSIWWGLPEPLTGDPTFADSWYVFREPFVIIVVCSLLRASCELLPLVKAERYSFIRQLQAIGLPDPYSSKGGNVLAHFNTLSARSKAGLPFLARARLNLSGLYSSALEDISLVCMLLTALTHLNLWSLIITFTAGILALPFWASRPLARRAVLVLLIAVFSVMTLYQYLAVLFWPPFTSFYTNEWPYTISNKDKYFYLGFGPSARAYEIIPDFITLMMLCIAMQHLRLDSRKHAAMTLTDTRGPSLQQSSIPASFNIATDTVWFLINSLKRVVRKRRSALSNNHLTQQSLPALPSNSVWDTVMLTVCGLSIKVVLSPVLFLASFEDNQSLFTVTYIVWAVWMLAFDWDIRLWRSSLWRLRLYNLFVLALQVMYQIPDIPAPSDCQAYSDCFTWQTIIGFEKYRSVIVTGAPSCVTSSSPDTGSNSDCSYAFSVTYGLAVQVIIFGLLAFQNRVLCSSTFQTLISQHDLRTKLSHWRSIRASRLWEVTKAKRVLEARRKSAARSSRLNRLVTKATQWFDMLSSGSGGLEESNALPPPPPVNIVAVPLSSTTVQVKWEPPPHVSGPDRLSYKVRARNMSSKSVFGQFDAEGKSDKGSCVIIVKGLLPGIVYNLQVCTCSIGGSGPYGHSVGNVVMPSKSSEAAETAPGNNEETGEGEAPATLSNRVASGVSRLQSFLLERIDPVLFHSPLGMFQNAVRMLSSFRGGLREVPAPQRPLRGQATESVAIPIDGDTKDADREDLFRHHIQMGRGDSESQTPLLGDDAVHVVLDVDVDEEQRAQRPARSNQVLEHGAHLTTVLYLCFLIGLCVLSNSMCLVVFAAVLYMLCTGQLFALLIVVFMTVVLVVEYPRPHTAVWKWGIAYCVVVIVLKTVIQLTFFCMYTTVSNHWHIALWFTDHCSSSGGLSLLRQAQNAQTVVQSVELIGLYKYSRLGYNGSGLANAIKWEFVLLISLLAHRSILRRRGLWGMDKLDEAVASQPSPSLLPTAVVSLDAPAVDEAEEKTEDHPVVVELEYVKRYVEANASLDVQLNTHKTWEEKAFGWLPSPILAYWNRVTNPDFGAYPKPGRDLYLYTFPLQMFLLLWILFGYSSMAEKGSSISASLSSNSLSGSMVLHVIYQTLAAVVERLAYLWRSLKLKLALQITVSSYVHYKVFAAIPTDTGIPFTKNPPLIAFYIFYMLYFAVSGAQLYHGYDREPPKDSLRQYAWPFPTLFSVYTALPFLRELRLLLDWWASNTSLEIDDWMTLDAMQTDLYLSGAATAGGGDDGPPEAQTKRNKFLKAGTWFIILLVALLGPLILFSNLNPVTDPNLVTSASVDISLIIPDNGVFSLYSTTHLSSLTPYTALPEAAWNAVLSLSGLVMPSWRGISQRLILPLSSDNLWSVTPESLALLNSSLIPNTGITIQITQVFTRPGPPNYQTVSLQNSVTLSESAIAELVDLFSGISSDAWRITGLLSNIVHLPAADLVEDLTSNATILTLELKRGSSSGSILDSVSNGSPVWWDATLIPALLSPSDGNPIVLTTVSDRTAPSSITSALGASGILAIYATVVLSIANYARDSFSVSTERIPYENMPDTSDLRELADSIQIAQTESYDGHYADEQQLYNLLKDIFRSPDVLMKVTKPKTD